MAKKDLLKRAASVFGSEEKKETEEKQPKTPKTEKTQDEAADKKTEEKTEQSAPQEETSKADPKEVEKIDDGTPSSDNQGVPEPKTDDNTKEPDSQTPEKKRGRKKSDDPVKDRVIVMVSKDPTITLLDSFNISRSAVARAVLMGTRGFLEELEKNSTEQEIIEAIEKKLAS
jgi:hypothetical protein